MDKLKSWMTKKYGEKTWNIFEKKLNGETLNNKPQKDFISSFLWWTTDEGFSFWLHMSVNWRNYIDNGEDIDNE